ncbi:hypothetical protein HND81_09260 [Neisseria meningitidis]|nr:hypothetical protein [Neisseria meningitidis]
MGRKQLKTCVGVSAVVRERNFAKVSDYYKPEAEQVLIWNDPTVGIGWPLQTAPLLSPKDLAGKVLAEAVTF